MIRLPTGLYVDVMQAKVVIPTPTPERFEGLPLVEIREAPSGVKVAVLPLHEDTYRYLHTMGVDVAGIEPLRYYYKMPKLQGKFDPYDHQIQGAGFHVAFKRSYNFSTMRVGKTGTALIAMDYLQRVKHYSACLIVCTVTNMSGVWEDEIQKSFPDKKVVLLDGTREERKEKLKRDADYYVVNFDGVKILEKELLAMVKEGVISLCIIDELSHYANARTGLWKSMNAVINDKTHPVEYVVGLTGSPGNSPEPVYAQSKLITPHNMKMRYTQWRDMTMYKVSTFTWAMNSRAKDLIESVLQPSIRFNKDDVFDLPEPERIYHHSPLVPEQERIIKQFKDHLMAEIRTPTGAKELAVADNRAIAVNKILQTCTGAVVVEDVVRRIDITPRLDDLLELVNSSKRKVIIFCAFRETISVLTSYFKKKGVEYRESHGGVTGRKRARELEEFQDPTSSVKVLVAHPRTTAFGVELSSADTMIFFGPPLSGYMTFAQAVERMSSTSQEADRLRIIFFYGSSEERAAFKSAERGERIGATINELFEMIST